MKYNLIYFTSDGEISKITKSSCITHPFLGSASATLLTSRNAIFIYFCDWCVSAGVLVKLFYFTTYKSCFLFSSTTTDNSYIYIYIDIYYFVIILSYDHGCQRAFSAQEKGNQTHHAPYFNNN